jgi:hypothetical protein
MSDKASLSVKLREPRSDEDVVEGVARLIRAVGKRAAASDPDSAAWLDFLQDELDLAYRRSVAGWRESGFSDTQIGRELCVTKQAVAQRWPRSESS